MLGLSVAANKSGRDHPRRDICSRELAVGLLSEVRQMATKEELARSLRARAGFNIEESD